MPGDVVHDLELAAGESWHQEVEQVVGDLGVVPARIVETLEDFAKLGSTSRHGASLLRSCPPGIHCGRGLVGVLWAHSQRPTFCGVL